MNDAKVITRITSKFLAVIYCRYRLAFTSADFNDFQRLIDFIDNEMMYLRHRNMYASDLSSFYDTKKKTQNFKISKINPVSRSTHTVLVNATTSGITDTLSNQRKLSMIT